MISLPGKGVQKDVGGGLLDILPVGGIPERRQRGCCTGRAKLSPHRFGDVVHEGKQAGRFFRACLHPDGLQREAVQKHIAAHGQAARAHGEQTKLAAVVECAASDDL